MTGLGQRRLGGVSDVVGIDKGLADRSDRQRHLARQQRLDEKTFVEIL